MLGLAGNTMQCRYMININITPSRNVEVSVTKYYRICLMLARPLTA